MTQNRMCVKYILALRKANRGERKKYEKALQDELEAR